jgi:hypothetical protein
MRRTLNLVFPLCHAMPLAVTLERRDSAEAIARLRYAVQACYLPSATTPAPGHVRNARSA